MISRRSILTLGGTILGATIIGAAVAGGERPASAVQFATPDASPVVCATSGVCFEVQNTERGGSGVFGTVSGKNGVGIFAQASNSSASQTALQADASGPSSFAILARALSTDPTHPSAAIRGQSANGRGVTGITTFNSTLPITAAAGVIGMDKSTHFPYDSGVEGTSTLGVGVAGTSKNGNAITGNSVNANGVVGQTSFFATAGAGQAGVIGQDLATPSPFGTPIVNVGVEGTTTDGTGVYGQSINGVAIKAFTSTGTALMVQSNSGPAIVAVGPVSLLPGNNGGGISISHASLTIDQGDISAGGGPLGGGLVAGLDAQFSAGSQTAIFAYSQSTPGPNAAPTLLVDDQNGGPIMLATNGSTNEMSLDGSGNMILAGTLTQNGTPVVNHQQPNGFGVGTYAAQQTMKTVEDLGEAQLQNGQAYVRLDSAYASVIDSQHRYLVFITPQGNCKGLYVTQKSPSGFAVEEMNQGQSSIAFDYRIVGESREANGGRLPLIPPIRNHRGFVQQPTLHRVLPVVRVPKLPLPEIRPGYVPSNPH
jgi:hypothetical protein